jgi:DNA polymerase I
MAAAPTGRAGDAGPSPGTVRAVLVDGHSLAFRAFFALPDLTSADGRPTGALHGFLNMLRNLVVREKPSHVAVAFDRGRPAFRMDLLPSYKAQREAAPDSLHTQVDLLREILPGLGVRVVEAPGFEGDDVLGTLARQIEADGGEVLLVSGDRDLLQLVDDQVTALFTRKGISDVVRWGPEQVEAEYGLPPRRLPEWKALAGDHSDNLPGVPGIGPKTATSLLAAVDSLDALLESDGDGLKPRQRDLLREHAEACRTQREVATIRTDVALDLSVAGLRFEARIEPEARALLEHLELRGILDRWPKGGAAARDEGGEAAEALAPQTAPMPAADAAAVGVWAEVTGTPGSRRLRRLAVWAREGALTLEAEDAEKGLDIAVVQAAAARLLADPDRPKSGFGLKELYAWCRAEAATLAGPLLDLGVAAYLLDSGRSAYTPSFVTARLSPGASWPETPEARAAAAAALAPVADAALAEAGMTDLYGRIEAPLMPVLADMEEAGIAVDRRALSRLGEEFQARVGHLEQEIQTMAKGPFNLNSPHQLAEVLFDRLGLPEQRRTKTGRSTDADVLQALTGQHPIVEHILLYRQLDKLRSTYIDGLLPLIAEDGRVHTTFHQTVAATGRLSSADPNLQNIPVRLDEGRRVRAAFVAGEGMRLVGADYSQVELRVLAHLSGDEALRQAFASGRDIHRETAAAVFGVAPADVSSDMRRRAKAVNFGIVYGISAFGLSRDLGITTGDAQAFIDAYFKRFPRVRAFLDETVAAARERGYSLTPDGRRRYLPDLKSPRAPTRNFAERAAKNSPIQGMAADIIKRAMVRAREAHLPGRLLLQVHDELVFEVPAGEAAELGRKARDVLEGAASLAVPLVVDLKVGESWAATVPFEPDEVGAVAGDA